ncbi:MAG: ABC transporter ATP-binding protein [Bauldia sp.]
MGLFRWFETRIDPFRSTPQRDPPGNVWRFYWHYLRQIPVAGGALLLLGAIIPILDTLLFVTIGRVVDAMSATPSGSGSWNAVGSLLAMVAGLLILGVVFGLGHMLLQMLTLTGPFHNLVRWQAHNRIMRRAMRFFQGEASGRIGTHLIEVGNTLPATLFGTVNQLWSTVILIVSVGVVFASLYWLFLVPLLLWLASYAVIVRYFMPVIRKRAAAHFEAFSQNQGRFVDTYANITTVKLFHGAAIEDGFLKGGLVSMMSTNWRLMRMYIWQWLAVHVLEAGLLLSVFAIAIALWIAGTVPLGAIVVATGLAIRLQQSGYAIVGGFAGIAQSVGTVQNTMKSIVPSEPEPARPAASGPPIVEGRIAFEDVAFKYPTGDEVLSDLSFTLPARGSLGIVGLSGAGKSTIINLITGLYAPQSGRITIDGMDIAGMSETQLLGSLSVVSQDPSLFNRSVRDNVGYGRPGASDEELMAALASASAADFVSKLVDAAGRKGLDAMVGERGIRLSGGQRQRIAIARALLKDTPILILDEPTSALDSETESAIQSTLAQLMERKTQIVVAHRVSTIARMDKIIVLDRGRVAEEGPHDALVALGGAYAGFWKRQSTTTGAADAVAALPPRE